jgi:protein-L-isoaspartate O-methyltransferase
VEVVEEFASYTEARLHQLGYSNVTVGIGDGTRGWAEHAPFDKILVTAAAEQPPEALLNQLAPGGLMVLTLGSEETQQLTVIASTSMGRSAHKKSSRCGLVSWRQQFEKRPTRRSAASVTVLLRSRSHEWALQLRIEAAGSAPPLRSWADCGVTDLE